MTCDEAFAAVLVGAASADVDAHVAGCARCAAERADAAQLRARLRVAPPPPAPLLAARVLGAATPLLAARRRATRPAWDAVARGLAVALAALPAVVALDWWLVRTLYALCAALLPAPLGTLVAAQYALLLALVVTLGYAAVPLVAAHQHRLEDAHG
jgi:hypothetical protein